MVLLLMLPISIEHTLPVIGWVSTMELGEIKVIIYPLNSRLL